MKRCLYTLIILTILLGVPSLSTSAGLTLRYQFKPGQLWECTRMSHMAFTVMGQQQTKKDRDTIVYTVSKGSKAHWVHLSARFERPAGNTEPNPVAMAKYDLTFTADVHVSGDTRNIAVSGIEKRLQDPSLDAGTKMALQQTYDILADTMPAAVFWFPELPEEALQPGDEFEDKRTHGLKNQYMQSTTQSRKLFVFEEVSQGLAYLGKGDSGEAIRAFARAFEDNPKDPVACFHLGEEILRLAQGIESADKRKDTLIEAADKFERAAFHAEYGARAQARLKEIERAIFGELAEAAAQ